MSKHILRLKSCPGLYFEIFYIKFLIYLRAPQYLARPPCNKFLVTPLRVYIMKSTTLRSYFLRLWRCWRTVMYPICSKYYSVRLYGKIIRFTINTYELKSSTVLTANKRLFNCSTGSICFAPLDLEQLAHREDSARL